MEHEGYYHIGTITRTHGVKGNVVLGLDVDDPSRYRKIKSVFLSNGNEPLTEHTLSAIKITGDSAIIGLEGITDMDIAAGLVRSDVYLPLETLPKLRGNKLYFHEAIGMTVKDAVEGELGVITKIFDMPEQPVAQVFYKGREVLFPLVENFIERVDRKNKILYINLPEGLINIYTG